MDVLAKEAGVARATVYEHFRSKRALLDELASSISRTVAARRARERSGDADPLVALARDARRRVPPLVGARGPHARAAHADRGDRRRPPGDGVDDKQLRRLVEALAAAGRLRPHWSVDEAVDALAALTSYSTYEQLRRAPRTPDQVEAMLAKLGVAIVGSP